MVRHTNGKFSVIHFNSRKTDKFKELLHVFNTFSVIAELENLLDDDKTADIHLEGYELFSVTRINKKKWRGCSVCGHRRTTNLLKKINNC